MNGGYHLSYHRHRRRHYHYHPCVREKRGRGGQAVGLSMRASRVAKTQNSLSLVCGLTTLELGMRTRCLAFPLPPLPSPLRLLRCTAANVEGSSDVPDDLYPSEPFLFYLCFVFLSFFLSSFPFLSFFPSFPVSLLFPVQFQPSNIMMPACFLCSHRWTYYRHVLSCKHPASCCISSLSSFSPPPLSPGGDIFLA